MSLTYPKTNRTDACYEKGLPNARHIKCMDIGILTGNNKKLV